MVHILKICNINTIFCLFPNFSKILDRETMIPEHMKVNITVRLYL